MAYVLRRLNGHHSLRRYFGHFSPVRTLNPSAVAVPPEGKRRVNQAGIQQLSPSLHRQLFNGLVTEPPRELVDLSRKHLSLHGLYGKTTNMSAPIEMNLPPLCGTTFDEHFHNIGMEIAEPYLSQATHFARVQLPPMPAEFMREPGWHRYTPINPNNVKRPMETLLGDFAVDKIDCPQDDCLVFDTEVLYKISKYAVMACAASSEAWYIWVSPWITGHSDKPEHLIPLPSSDKERVIVGHNIGYDRARIREQYNFKEHRIAFIDTMSLHVAVNGMCSRQRPTWLKHRKNKELKEQITAEANAAELASILEVIEFEEFDEPWISKSSTNSLLEVARFHCNILPDKSTRDLFGELDRDGVFDRFQELIKYCAEDVRITHQVYKAVFPSFRKVCPHPVSFVGLTRLASVFLPVNKSWKHYIAKAEEIYQEMSTEIQKRLITLANEALKLKDSPDEIEKDPWLCQLDWSVQKIQEVMDKKTKELRPPKGSFLPGYPKWYRALHPTSTKPINISVRTRIAPLLLRLSWEKNPLVWSDKYGWTFRLVDSSNSILYEAKHFVRCDFSEDPNKKLQLDTEGIYFKVPHKDGAAARCCSPMAKNYIKAFEDGLLESEFLYARDALNMNAACSYWICARERITSQFVVWGSHEHDLGVDENLEIGVILPQIIPMGTITRRAVEKTWLTASNAKKNRIGSELKAMVRAPEGYTFVGADVDSEELWIASLIGDAQFKHHGATAMGWMTLEGTKSAGTDMHSKTASILGISRNAAKIFNYGRIYGAGLPFACQLLQQFNPSISEVDAKKVAANLYKATKGHKLVSLCGSPKNPTNSKKKFWRGGTESFVFNKLEEIAEEDVPRTPVLGCTITEALLRKNLSKGAFMTSRINWAIQSSGVDYLHLLIVSMEYLIRRYNINARLSLTVHDEIRYLVREEDKYRAAMALQISNLWTRAMFCQQLGINDVPQGCAFFSAVDIDKVLRKEVDLDCVTPSHPTPILPGESLDIQCLLAKANPFLDENIIPKTPFASKRWPYEPRTSAFKSTENISNVDIGYLEAQTVASDYLLSNKRNSSRIVNYSPAQTARDVIQSPTTNNQVPLVELEKIFIQEMMNIAKLG
ncbi:DNA polymerase gamma, mitochondrial [Neolecta irregularis DAH-3]|uniref:DNA-directed DNA polymerase n=1 Tax=Neolecta irregularis (strain DAH-3) TaxID=1198029 RepID=A0A1U7LTZ9_NEOID|nr:DNA polymerase gamma, mitochondrial [Neolecta irregularis DAH-3]|eukprot:OLL25991.1 DNA polymerase gamma, mitochondrial [Neolecta irregularis DAH-3]